MIEPTLPLMFEIFRRQGVSFTGDGCFGLFEVLTPADQLAFDRPFWVFVMSRGCDQPDFQGKAALFYFLRSEHESDDTLHCWDRWGIKTPFVASGNPSALREWARYRDAHPLVAEIEAAAIADAKRNMLDQIEHYGLGPQKVA